MSFLRTSFFALTLVALGTAASQAQEQVRFGSQDGTEISAVVFRPAGAGPFPAVIGLHGCAGLWRRGGIDARSADWAARLSAAGFLVVFPDSFTPRGMGSACETRTRAIQASGRAADVAGAAAWLARQPQVDRRRIAVIGWSNGGATALHAAAGSGAYAQVIAFYPGCRTLLTAGWRPRVPVTILQGEADDWTPAAPCAELASRTGARFVGFAGAYHDFDHPGMALRQRRAAYSQRPDGMVTIGTDPAARSRAIGEVMAILRRM
jgi:dienelactone hydrolase